MTHNNLFVMLCFLLLLYCFFIFVLEIPIFHILNARITFGNIFSSDAPVERVSIIKETVQRENEDGETVFETVINSCAVDETVFDIPTGYRVIGKF